MACFVYINVSHGSVQRMQGAVGLLTANLLRNLKAKIV